MPNTLAHIGIQTLAARAGLRGGLEPTDLKWIWLACIIPDLPWILQRALRAAAPELSPHDARLYAIAQSALFLCVVLSAIFACFSNRPWRVLGVLSFGAAVHLLLDAVQTKWANGVHLFAPLSWDLVNFGLFWPEDWPTLALTAAGALYALYAFARHPKDAGDLRWPPVRGIAAAVILIAFYLTAPLAFMDAVERSGSHHVATLRAEEQRPGREIGFDRARVADGGIAVWTGERLALTGAQTPETGAVSIIGRFAPDGSVEVTALHPHPAGLRDGASYLGLFLVALWWAACLANLYTRRSS